MEVTPKFFRTPESLRAWFAKDGSTKTELWMGYYTKASGRGGVVYRQALDEALCVGWIDGQVKSVDDICYMQRWTPRKPKSIWSNVNTKRVQELIAEGRMTPAGMAAFERRDPKRAGVYSFENEPPKFSPELLKRFKADKAAWKFFEAQPPGYRRMMTAYVMMAKRDETRERRLELVRFDSARLERVPVMGGPAPKKTPSHKKS